MTETYPTLTALFTDIAEAIREKTGDTDSIIADDFPDVIREKLQVAPPPPPPAPLPYLTFSSPKKFTLKVNDGKKHWDGTLKYSTDASNWYIWNGSATLSSASDGNRNVLYLRGTVNKKITGDGYAYRWVLTGSNIACTGNIENLLDYTTVESGGHPPMADYCFRSMFYNCTALTSAPELPATTLAGRCYQSMFYGCTSLITAPALPATTLTDSCYNNMFRDCTSLITVPALPATTLADYCYYGMFWDCSRIKLSTTQTGEYTLAYRIPTTGDGKSATNALSHMFTNTGGTFKDGVPALNTTYYLSSTNTIVGVTNDTPETPENNSYLTFSSPSGFTLKVNDATKHWDGTLEYSTDASTWSTWNGTTTLSAATSGSDNALYLRGTSNTKITGDNYNYRWVLTGSNIACSGNIEALLDYATVQAGNHPNMADYCYKAMFNDCTALTSAPELPATTLAGRCYQSMFYGCTSLITAPALPATTLTDSCYNNMFRDCTSLITVPALPATTLADYCYYGMFWDCSRIKLSTTQTGEYTLAYRIPTTGDGKSATNALSHMFTNTGGTFKDGVPALNTTYYLSSTNTIVGVTNDTPETPENNSYLTFSSPSEFILKVNNATKHWEGTLEYSTDASAWSTWDGTTTLSSATSGSDNVLYLRGTSNTKITGKSSKNRWVLTGSDIACSGNIETLLDYATVQAGSHPTMTDYCYYYMFNGCTALTKAPELPATTLTKDCYYYMFMDCTSLTQAPALPATTLAYYCYASMFYGCTSLTTAPALPATTLTEGCYYGMFKGCTSLKLSSTQTGEYTQAYRIPTSGTGNPATAALGYMFDGTGGTFTGTPDINTTYYLSNTNSIVG